MTEISAITITDNRTGGIIHAPSLVHYTGRTGVARVLGKGEGWDVMCACGSAAEGFATEDEAKALYLRHAVRAAEALRESGQEFEIGPSA